MPDIDFQRIVLNIIPKQGDEPVVFYASQYETTRPFIADLMWGDTEFIPGDDCWAEIDIRKNDDNLVVITEDVTIDNNEVSVILPVQALTCIGKNLGQVKIYAGEEQLIAALNFILEVQPDPLAGGVTSETDIDNLTQQIEDIAEEVIGEDYYDKTEVDALLADKADVSDLPDMTDYYTKTATDSLLSEKANTDDLATVATTGDYDDLLNKPVLPDMSDYYTAVEVDNLLYDMLPVGFTTGNPCIFDTEIAGPVKGLTAQIVCGGGGGTPSTPIALVPHSEINLDVNGDTYTVDFYQTVYGGIYNKNGTVSITWDTTDLGSMTYVQYVVEGKVLFRTNEIVPMTADYNEPKMKCAIYTPVSWSEINYGNTDAEMGKDADGHIFIYDTRFASMTPEQVKSTLSGVTLCYEMTDTPTVIYVSSLSAFAVNGTNTITSDCIGDVTTTYKDSIQHYIDTRI